MIFSFVFIGFILGILIGIGAGIYYANGVTDAYEQEITELKKGYEEHREAERDYINKLIARNKELEKNLHHY